MSPEMRLFGAFIVVFGLCHGVSEANDCTSRGRFPNDDAPDCRGYTMCLLGVGNKYTQYKLRCPEGFIYTHIENQCTNITHYRCSPESACDSPGNFKHHENCSTYISCAEGLNGLVTARKVDCPPDEVFHPILGVCVNQTEYECSDNINLVDDLATITTTELPPDLLDFAQDNYSSVIETTERNLLDLFNNDSVIKVLEVAVSANKANTMSDSFIFLFPVILLLNIN